MAMIYSLNTVIGQDKCTMHLHKENRPDLVRVFAVSYLGSTFSPQQHHSSEDPFECSLELEESLCHGGMIWSL